ncbi:MAG: ribosome maturation factor RimP [Butyricicoccus pullicaecorum]|nr:ribosome maturation factor RimP [Butyricicoccus pullicaecorum]
MALPLCEQVGVSLWDVEFEKEGGQYMLTITIDREDGVDIDQCEKISRAIDPMLDAREFDALPPYTLCVSSAGLERRLKKPEHFAKYLGEIVEVKFYKAIDGAKTLEGKLMGYDNGDVTIEADGQTTVYEAKDIAAVRLTIAL